MEKRLLSSFWLEPLEPRLLFSADLVPPPPEGGLAGGEAVAVVETPLRPAGSATEQSQTSGQLRRELVFIDGEVKDYQQLLDDFIARQEGSRNIQAVVLDPAADGIAQISAYLRTEGNIDAIHLVSHGSDGAVKLGNVWLSAQNLDTYAEAIEGWRLALSEEADLLLYGCNLAQGEAGRALLDNLRLITGADVASTDDITGHQRLGGDWDLEYRLGAIETGIAFSTGLQQNWNGILATTYLANETATDSAEVKIDQNWGQSFSYTSGNGTYVVDQLSLQLRKEVGAVGQTLTVSLHASWNGPVLGSNTLVATELTSSLAWKAFTFGEVSLNDGQTYYIRVSSSSNAGKVHVGVNPSGGYAGGDLINKDGVAESGKDLAFRVADVSQDGLWITTNNGLNAGGNVWGKADLVQLFDPNLSFSPGVTGGTFNTGAPLSTDADGKQVNGVHYVTSAIQVGVNGFQLLPGDLLFLSRDATSIAFGELNIDKDDVVLYRPDSPGNYSTGTYSILIRNMVPGQELRDITLVEKNTVVGGVTLQAGDFLFLRQGGTEEKQVWRYTDYTAGNVDGGGTASVLIDGGEEDININKRLVGIDLVETTITLGGRTLNAGTILLAVDSGTTVGKNNLAVTEFDIFALEVNPTEIGSATASLFFKGADLGLSNKIDGFSLKVAVNAAPVLTPAAANLTPISEDNVANSGSLVSTILAGSASDANGDPLGLALTATVAGNGSWQYSTNGGSSWTPVGAVADNNALLLRGTDRIRFVPDGKNADTASISYRAWDQSSGSAGQKATTTSNGGSSAYSLATDTATINVTAVNDAPTDITLDNLTVPENGPGAVIGNLTTSDVDTGDSHSYTVNDARFEVVGSQLKLKASAALDFEAEPTVSLTVTSTDSAGLSIQKALVIIVTNVNENPVAGTDFLSTVENVPLLITTADLLLNDADEDLDPLSIVGFTQPANGAVVDNLNGTWTYTPGSSFYGVDSLTYTLSDGNGGTAIGTININVSEAANTAPVAVVDNLLTVEDSPLTITVASDIRGNDYDNDGDPLTVTGFTQPANGTLVDNLDGSWTYTPDLNFNGSDSFSYTLIDDSGGSAVGIVNITVSAANDPPTITGAAGGLAVNDNASIAPFSGVTVGDVDTPGQTLTVVVSLDVAAKGQFSTLNGFTDQLDGSYTFSGSATDVTAALRGLVFNPTANRGVVGSIETTEFTISVDDGSGPVTDSSTTVASTSMNDAPTIAGTAAGQTVNDNATNTPFSGVTIGDVDSPDQSLTVSVTLDVAAKGTFSSLNGFIPSGGGGYTFTGTAAAATAAIRGLVFDPANNRVAPGGSETTTFTIAVNDEYAITTDSTTTVVSTSINDAPSIAGTSSGQLMNDNDTLAPFSGVTIGDPDRPAQPLTVIVTLDDGVKGTFSTLNGFTDHFDGSYSFVGTASEATAAIQGLLFDPTDNRMAPGGSESTVVEISVNDGSGAVTDNTTRVAATSINDAPSAIGLDNLSVAENSAGAIIGNLSTSDVDAGDSHSYSVDDVRFEVVGGQLKLKSGQSLDYESEPTVAVTVTSTDAGGLSVNQLFTLTVTNVNETPSAIALDNLSVAENSAGAIIGNLSTGDVDAGDSHSYSVDDVRFEVVGNQLKLKSGQSLDSESESTVAVTVTSTDGGGLSTSQLFTLSVSNVNEAPVVVTDRLATLEDNALSISTLADLLGNDTDIDGDHLTLSSFTQPAHGTLVANDDGTLTYTPGPNFNGSDSFSYTISDGKGGTATGTAIILVTAVGDTPQVTNGSAIAGRQSELIFVTPNAADGAEVTHFRIFGISGGTLYLADGVTQVNNGDFISVAQGRAGLKFSPNSGSVAPGSFQAEASEDGLTASAQSGAATATITVTRPSQQPDKPAEENKKEQAETTAEDDAPIVVPGFSESLTRAAEITEPSTDNLFLPQDPPRRTSLTLSLPVLIREREMTTADLSGEIFKELKSLFESAPDLLKGFENSLASLDISGLTPEAYTRVRDMLDAIQNDLGQQIRLEKTLIGSAIATSVGLSAGYVVWMLQGGSLLASVLSSIPAWQLADPLSILAGSRSKDEEEDEDSLEQIIADGSVDDPDKDDSESKD